MKLKIVLLLLAGLVVGVGCTDSGTGPKTSPNASMTNLGAVSPQSVPPGPGK